MKPIQLGTKLSRRLPYEVARVLRSFSENLLRALPSNMQLVTAQNKAFLVATPRLWLPLIERSWIWSLSAILEVGYSKCVLIGHDWGGMIAWLAAICYPEMVTKLIVVNFPHPSVFTEYILRHPSQMIKCAYYYFFQMPWFPELMFTINDFKTLKNFFTSQSSGIGRKGCRLTAEDIDAYLYVFSQPGALTGPINHYRNFFSLRFRLRVFYAYTNAWFGGEAAVNI
ncbi:Epoxide hydrolase 4 [Varanus komodoensis]|nr:Epoxide hydrolase 4 [Varanus komodoensis]